MAWGDPQDYWWLQPRGGQAQANSVAAQINAGREAEMQRRRDAVTASLRQEQQRIENLGTTIKVAEYFNKLNLQNKVESGNAELSGVLADPSFNWTDPAQVSRIYGVAAKHPYIAEQPFFKELIKMSNVAADNARMAEQARNLALYRGEQVSLGERKLSLAQLHEDRRAAEKMTDLDLKAQRLDQIGEFQKAQTEGMFERLRIMEDRYGHQAWISEKLADIKEASQENDTLRLSLTQKQIELREQELNLKRDRLNRQSDNLSPEQRALFSAKMRALQERGIGGKLKDPKTGERTIEAYNAAEQEIIDQFFPKDKQTPGRTPAPSPAAAPGTPAAPAAPTTDGTRQNPKRLTDPAQKKDLKPGEFYMDPAGRLFQME